MSRLPDRPSDLLTVALADLAAAERNPLYRVSMDTWHVPQDGVCSVCMAGAVMAGTLGMNPDRHLSPGDAEVLGPDLEAKLQSLDDLRCGDLGEALSNLGMELPEYLAARHHIPEYEDNVQGFHRELHKLAGLMRSEGI